MPRYLVKVEGREFDIDIGYHADGFNVMVDGQNVDVKSHSIGATRSVLLVNDRSFEVDVHPNNHEEGRTVFMLGVEINAEVEQYNLAQLRKRAGMTTKSAAARNLRAPMPGLILEVKVEPGQKVARNDPLVIIEAMKMENVLKAQADVTVKSVNVARGDSVEKGDIILEFE